VRDAPGGRVGPLDRRLCGRRDNVRLDRAGVAVEENKLLLDGMKIISFCHFLQGPEAMQYLSDMGADVIKIEPPQGAFERQWSGADRVRVGGVSAFFLCANRNARSLALDLKKPEAREVIFRLVETSHAVAENFRPGTLDRLGLGYEAVRARKPDIIYATAAGYGASGPYANRPGQDLLIQAMSGLAAATGNRQSGPVAVGCAAADQHGAALLALGIAGAYARWLRTGQGTRVESTLLGAGIDLQMESLVTYYASGSNRDVFQHSPHLGSWFHEAPYGIYRIADGHVALSLNDLEKLAAALECPDIGALAGQNAYRARDAIAAVIAGALEHRCFADIAAAFDALGLWYARVEDFDDLLDNRRVQHNQTFRDVAVNGETIKLLNHPVRYDGKTLDACAFALSPGADTREVLEQAGFRDSEIRELLKSNVAFAAD
jgi:crotonobetainyl-CoA:carnitine CoA-transferase CaiB-like acyl-CoA transferase